MQEQPQKHNDHILIVDDEESVRRVFAARLAERYACTTAANTQEALDYLGENEIALVLSDVQMPGLSGIELLRKIISDFPDVAVIIVSGIDRSQRVIDALRIGACDYLVKPCDLDVLELSVVRALERRALLQDAKRYKQDLERRNEQLALRTAELERLQAQLVHSERMASVGQLAGGVAHELNNPAGFIYSNMESLGKCADSLQKILAVYDRGPLPSDLATRATAIKGEIHYETLLPELCSIIADCREGARRIRDIVLNLRTFSRLDEAELKTVDLHVGLDATVRLLPQYYGGCHIRLKRQYGNLPPVECFAGQLNQVWMNLLTNAAQAIGDRTGEVRIETGLEGKEVKVRISDTGKGIAPENLKRIFDPFFTTKPVGEGTGLGLSISYGIIERHGGTITVESEPARGTTFTTLIPLKAPGA